jgi:hypothetical protein
MKIYPFVNWSHYSQRIMTFRCRHLYSDRQINLSLNLFAELKDWTLVFQRYMLDHDSLTCYQYVDRFLRYKFLEQLFVYTKRHND